MFYFNSLVIALKFLPGPDEGIATVVGDSVAYYSLSGVGFSHLRRDLGVVLFGLIAVFRSFFCCLWQRAAGDFGEGIILSSYSIHSSSIQEYIHLSVLWELRIILLFCMALFLRSTCSCLCDVGCSLVPRPVCLERTA